MDVVRFVIEKPVTVIVGVILLVLFGLIGLYSMPYQLTPTVTEPEITVTTIWPGATPYEIEREIIEEQEKTLKGIPGLLEMESSSFNNQGNISLRFKIGTDVDDALLRVSNKINEVPSYPENVEKPVISATGAATSPVIWMILRTKEGNPNPPRTYRTYFEEEVRQHIERVPGVADLFIGGGTEREMHVVVRPERLAAYGLTITDVIGVLSSENVNVSAGTMGVGRREFRVRTVGELQSPEEMASVVILSTGERRVFLGDVADVRFGYEKSTVAMMHNATEGMAIGVKPEPGTNVLELTDRVEEVIKSLNAEKLDKAGIYLDWVYDQRPYINGAIGLVRQNILIGGVLAVSVLLVFLGSFSSTIVIGTAIPISILGTFIVMQALGRNLNVVSLAGISFATGMLVDNAIVVLENIDRHRKQGKTPFQSAYDGTREVWGAILISTVTTIAIFLPVVFVKEEAGQLFRDLAIAISTSVTLSLFVSLTVIPMLSKRLLALAGKRGAGKARLSGFGTRVLDRYMDLVRAAVRTRATRAFTVVVLMVLSAVSVYALFPKMEYLPQGNRNLVINILIPPPGLSFEERQEIGEYIFEAAKPHLKKEEAGLPGINNMFYVGSEQIMLFGAISTHEERAGELIPLFTRTIFSIPGMFGISNQAGIFETRLGRGRTVEVDVSGDDMNQVVRVVGTMFGMVKEAIPEAQVRPIPSLEITYPEVRIIPDRDRLRAAGLSVREFGVALDVLNDGRKTGEFKKEGAKTIDLVVKASEEDIPTPEELFRSLVVTRHGIVPVSSLSDLVNTTGITEIRHLERRRTITLQITPPITMALEEAMDIVRERIVPGVQAQGLMEGIEVKLTGAADKLTETRRALQWNFVLAIFITYLLMASLFGSFIYPVIILFTVPLATAGGFIGLKLVNLFIAVQPLDILTMLGFIILVGVVVNNAILIVHQALNFIHLYGMEPHEAVIESTRTRIRPIYMTTLTTVFGLLPLVVAPGPGSELYRGLGSVMLAGLAVSTVFTIFIIPSLLMFIIGKEKKREGES